MSLYATVYIDLTETPGAKIAARDLRTAHDNNQAGNAVMANSFIHNFFGGCSGWIVLCKTSRRSRLLL